MVRGLVNCGCTLGHLRDAHGGAGVVFTCTSCGHSVEMALEPLLARYGASMVVPAIRGRCTRCGAGGVAARPDWPRPALPRVR